MIIQLSFNECYGGGKGLIAIVKIENYEYGLMKGEGAWDGRRKY